MNSCPRCGAAELYAFQSSDPRVTKGLPSACRSCGAIVLDGAELRLPDTHATPKDTHATPKDTHATPKDTHATAFVRDIDAELSGGARADVGKYFSMVYKDGYRDGLTRAWAFFAHDRKEGRLARMRRLWDGMKADRQDSEIVVTMPSGIYDEITLLLRYGGRHASRENKHSAV